MLGHSDINPDKLADIVPELAAVSSETLVQLRNDALYEQYTDRQNKDAELIRANETTSLDPNIDYSGLGGLSSELRGKLSDRRPTTVFEASKIEGMTPAALTLLIVASKTSVRRTA